MKYESNLNTFRVRNTICPSLFWLRGFKGTVVNRSLSSLHGGSLGITLIVPLTVEN